MDAAVVTVVVTQDGTPGRATESRFSNGGRIPTYLPTYLLANDSTGSNSWRNSEMGTVRQRPPHRRLIDSSGHTPMPSTYAHASFLSVASSSRSRVP